MCDEICKLGSEVLEQLGWRHTPDSIRSAVDKIPRTTAWVHLFCGKRSMDKQFWKAGLVGISYDYAMDNTVMNILTPLGKAMVLLGVLTLVPAGLLCGGPVCTSWVFICRHSEAGRMLANPWLLKRNSGKLFFLLPGSSPFTISCTEFYSGNVFFVVIPGTPF